MITNWLDRVIAFFAPTSALRRLRARATAEITVRHFEAASGGRRTQGWRRTSGDANSTLGSQLASLRDHARDLVRNNPYAESALATIVDHVVGWGITAAPKKESAKAAPINVARARWKAWAETTACDAEGRQDFYGLQAQVMRTVIEAGECLVRRRWRRPEDGLPLPLQLQVLEPDYLDAMKTGEITAGGGRIIQGVEFDVIGRRVAYWLFAEHPGATFVGAGLGGASRRIPASEILHVFKPGRPGQIRAPSWFAPVILRMKDFDEYEDAALLKQKIAACLAAITTDVDGSAPAIGTPDTTTEPQLDMLEPGVILNAPPGRSVTVVEPPSVSEHGPYSQTILRGIATGLGVTYEDLTGCYDNLPFSAARMSRLRHWARVHGWRWKMLIPQFCDPAWAWAMESAAVMNLLDERPAAEWTAPAMPMVEPDKEGLAYQRNIRSGIMTLSEAIRERGYEPETLLTEMAADWKTLDALGLILDSDPRKTTQAGQPRDLAKATGTPVATAASVNGNGNGGGA